MTDPINEMIQAYRRTHCVPGISVTAAYRGKVVLRAVGGYRHGPKAARRNPKESEWVPVTGDTYFRLASVSKPVTAVAAMRMVERGELDLDANVRRYLPDFWYRRGSGISVRQLLGHTGGIKHYKGRKNTKRYQNCRFDRCQDVVHLLKGDGMAGLPGKQYTYSTHGFTILGAAMEAASGLTFPKLIHREFKSLRDWRPQCDGPFVTGNPPEISKLWGPRKPKRLGRGVHNNYERIPEDIVSWKWPGGGMQSTSEGLCRLGAQILDGTLLSEDATNEMWTPHQLWNRQVNSKNYGLGWVIGRTTNPRIVAHAGEQRGASSYLRIDRNRRLVVAILTNRKGVPVRSLGVSIMSELSRQFGPRARPPGRRRTRPGVRRHGVGPGER